MCVNTTTEGNGIKPGGEAIASEVLLLPSSSFSLQIVFVLKKYSAFVPYRIRHLGCFNFQKVLKRYGTQDFLIMHEPLIPK